jgi:NAD(P)-dependent dehydrogenase (short-subunit alcohol dehydrogenase family)
MGSGNNLKRLQGRVVLVAGGGGIGKAIALRFAQEGAHLILGDNHLDRGQSLAEQINRTGGSAIAAFMDGTNEDSIATAVARACEHFGGLDGLQANFAALSETQSDSDVVDMPLSTLDKTMTVNARGFFLCTRHAIPPMVRRGGGSVIYTSSIAAHLGEASRVAYAMSKAAVHALMRHVAVKFGPSGIRANVVAPGMVKHEGWSMIPPAMASELENMGKRSAAIKSRIATAEDVSALSTLLMSDEGAYITGQVLCVDGGTTMRA